LCQIKKKFDVYIILWFGFTLLLAIDKKIRISVKNLLTVRPIALHFFLTLQYLKIQI